MLYVDAATFLCSFALLSLFVPARPPLPQSDDGRGVLAGIRFLLHDPLLRVLGVTALVANGLGQMLGAGLTVLAYEEYSSSKVAGAFFAAFGARRRPREHRRGTDRRPLRPAAAGRDGVRRPDAADLRALARSAGAGA